MKFITLAALAGAIKLRDDSDPMGRNVDTWLHTDQYISGYNGADEDEIMDNIFSKFSKEGLTPSGHKTGQKLLMKDEAKLAAQVQHKNVVQVFELGSLDNGELFIAMEHIDGSDLKGLITGFLRLELRVVERGAGWLA